MRKKRILIVEDEPIVGLELQETLEREGYVVSPVIGRGDDVLEVYLQEKPDLILMDIHLNGFIDGIDATRRLRLLPQEIPVIYMTAYNNEATRSKALKTQPKAFLVKPIQSNELIDSVRNILRN